MVETLYLFLLKKYGQLGLGDNVIGHGISKIGNLARKKIIQISLGYRHSMVLSADGRVYSFGGNNVFILYIHLEWTVGPGR